jgi:uncharacterized protein (DUF1697 family)
MRRESSTPVGTYVALLRGVNVGGKNMVSMGSLKESFERLGFGDVSTYINSGNLLFRAKDSDARKLEGEVERMLSAEYKLDCKVVVRSYPEMAQVVEHLPADWAEESGWKHNVMFLRHSIDSETVMESLKPTDDIERVVYRPGALLWSVRASDVTRTAFVKLPGHQLYQDMTVRNLNTTRKLYELLKRMSEA